MNKEDFMQAGFTVVGTENKENKLLHFLKEHYPSVIKDNEIDLNELKAIAGLPIDEKVNGYGLNFVGRNFARAKYAQKTAKEFHLNKNLSKNIDTTQNLVLKGDNLDSLKILKSYYTGKIKCIYIDPPYNTEKDEFIYPDKFDKEETEVLGLVNLSKDDFARMEFSFKTKKSHNGWLSFMYPRLLLARDLLRDDGVIFISIDDNEQANLKLLCDDVFGDENFVAEFVWKSRNSLQHDEVLVSTQTERILLYCKNKCDRKENLVFNRIRKPYDSTEYSNPDNDPRGAWLSSGKTRNDGRPSYTVVSPTGKHFTEPWIPSPDEFKRWESEKLIWWGKDGNSKPRKKSFQKDFKGNAISDILMDEYTDEVIIKNEKLKRTKIFEIGTTESGTNEVKNLFEGRKIFDYPKPSTLLKFIVNIATKDSDIILDFFAGSGTTGHAVMQLNAEDGGNRKFILCQIDEPIKKDKPAYQFFVENNLPPVISSITVERLKRAGEKIVKEFEAEAGKPDLFEENKKQVPDIGFKVFDSVEAPKLKLDGDGQISILFNDNDALSRIYNMIFTVGLDEPTKVPEEVVQDCMYKIGNHYYITNSERISKDDFADAIKSGKVFIDGWTASLSGTLQNYKEDVKIVF